MQELSTKKLVTLSMIGIILGITLISYNYVNKKRVELFETINMELYELKNINDEEPEEIVEDIPTPEEPIEEIETTPIIEEEKKEEPNKEPVIYYYYIGTLEIPKIGLSKGFVDINDPDNTIDKNISIIKPSSYPNVDKGNFIIAAHSGNSYIGFFNQLYQLNKGDIANVYYNNIKYTYTIVNIYTQPKTGKINIYRDMNKTTLTLVTCTNNDDTTQTIYIAELTNTQNY